MNAYILWAVSEADVAANQPQRTSVDLANELQQAFQRADGSDNAYLIALSAAALMNSQRTEQGMALLKQLNQLQQPDGSLNGTSTVTSSGGISRRVETTALAAIA